MDCAIVNLTKERMDQTNQLNKCRNFLSDHDTGVIATATADGRPHASVVNYFMDHDISQIFFLARQDAQKFKNIVVNPYACLVVCDNNFASSVEVKGSAFKLDDSPKVTDLMGRFARFIRQKNHGPLPIVREPGSELYLFELRPQHLTYADFYRSPNDKGEYFELYL